ncbi:pathogenesis-related protein 1-like [Lolium rigidum]|uniref:pathogenesis-related protein 1-like n=1 Tax=Lolium rigidum TaxID=89674 RepID=UPI001F5D3A95|nr:pathogenesis-related protein 1-like [Lolium rigidum]
MGIPITSLFEIILGKDSSKLVPDIITNAHPVEGEGNIGSVRQFNFTSVPPFSFMKEKLDFVDAEKCECKSTLIEGGGIGTSTETTTLHIKVKPTAICGSVVKVELNYKLPLGVEVKEEISKAKNSVTIIFKGVEAYLVANQDAYN